MNENDPEVELLFEEEVAPAEVAVAVRVRDQVTVRPAAVVALPDSTLPMYRTTTRIQAASVPQAARPTAPPEPRPVEPPTAEELHRAKIAAIDAIPEVLGVAARDARSALIVSARACTQRLEDRVAFFEQIARGLGGELGLEPLRAITVTGLTRKLVATVHATGEHTCVLGRSDADVQDLLGRLAR